MATKLMITVRTPEDAQAVRDSGCEILAEYPSSLLVRCEEAQHNALQQAEIEMAELPEAQIRLSGATFAFANTMMAEEMAPVAPPPNRTAYYLLKLIGPPKAEWLETIRTLGGTIQANLSGFTLLIGILPAQLPGLQQQPWVEASTPYRPAMKVSPKLRPGVARELDAPQLAVLDLVGVDADRRVQVEVSVFPGESTAAVAAQVRDAGGLVLAENPKTVKAIVPSSAIEPLAERQGVQAILPHEFPELHNDKAAAVIGAPVIINSLPFRGNGQIVAVADSGLDTGEVATIHPDFSGRVAGIVSWGNTLGFVSNDPPPFDDGPQDRHSGHGTHVAGSVLGSGAAAAGAGSAVVPQGIAPEASLFFQAVEQRVTWKTPAQLVAMGITPPSDWPPPPVGLYGLPDDLNALFEQAYQAGARIHTNSWGASVAGTYNANAREVDEFMWHHRDILLLFSAGNEGRDSDADGIIDPDSIGSPGTAKNCLTIGASESNRPAGSVPSPGLDAAWNALGSNGMLRWPRLGPAGHVSDNTDGMAAFSSRGPTDDGRIKPDVVAPGTNILSTRTTIPPPSLLWGEVEAGHPLKGLYVWSGGTSMSTPLVAGAAALVRQYLVEQRGHAQDQIKPSGALIKAFLINGAAPMAGQFPGEIPPRPNNVCGFGRINLRESLLPDAQEQVDFADEPDHAVETGEIRRYRATAASTTGPLKVTLVWTDSPSAVNLGALQNSLYLQVVSPSGSVIDGDTTPFPIATNNVQQISIESPEPGTYEIRVRGISVTQQAPGASGGPNPRQDFALVASNVASFEL